MFGAIVVAVAVVANVVHSVQVRRTHVSRSLASLSSVHRAAEACFSNLTWRRVSGPGSINRQLRVPFVSGPVVSADVVSIGSEVEVHVWTSAWSGGFGLVNFAFPAIRKMKRVASAVEDLPVMTS